MRLLFLITCLLIAQQSIAMEGQSGSPFHTNEIEKLMGERKIPGLAIAKINDAKLSFIQTYGFADIDNNIRVTSETMFNVASISKPIMGITLLQLVDKDLLSLDADINDYLSFKIDNPYYGEEKITLRNLATHTSSIADYYQPSSFAKNIDSPTTLDQHIRSLLVEGGSEYNNGEDA